MSWLALVLAGCAGGSKDSGPKTLTEVDDCSDGHVGFESSEAAMKDAYCRYAVACDSGDTYEECVKRFTWADSDCQLELSLYDGYRVCACVDSWHDLGCSADVPDICTQPWWDCGPLTR